MVQAARSGGQNIAEGSQASGTSKKFELKLTNVARASLEELRPDYEDYLRQRSLPLWPEADPRRKALVARRCTTADAVADWVREVHGLDGQNGPNGQPKRTAPSMTSMPSIRSTLPRDRGECRAGAHRCGLCAFGPTDRSSGGGFHRGGRLHGAAAPHPH